MTKKREFNSRWGNAIADDYQYCHVPGYILRNYAKCVSLVDVVDDKGEIDIKRGQIVDLDMQDMMFVIHIMAFKYDAPNGKATPGLPTIAEYTGLHVTSVRRIKQKLISFGLLTVESSSGRPDVYNFAGLHDQCVRLEQELVPVEGVIVTPSKSASGSKSARGWASKSARGSGSKSASRRIESNSEVKKEKNPRATSKKKDLTELEVWQRRLATVSPVVSVLLAKFERAYDPAFNTPETYMTLSLLKKYVPYAEELTFLKMTPELLLSLCGEIEPEYKRQNWTFALKTIGEKAPSFMARHNKKPVTLPPLSIVPPPVPPVENITPEERQRMADESRAAFLTPRQAVVNE